MTEVIYLSNINLLIVICVISGLAVWYMHNIKKENKYILKSDLLSFDEHCNYKLNFYDNKINKIINK